MPTYSENVTVQNSAGETTMQLRNRSGDLRAGGPDGVDGDVLLFAGGSNINRSSEATIRLDGSVGNITAGKNGQDGDVRLYNADGVKTIDLNAGASDIKLFDSNGQETIFLDGTTGNIILGGGDQDGDLRLKNESGDETIRLNGRTGDITLLNADLAEDFRVESGCEVEPGMVMALGDEGALRPVETPYDKRVVGVVSGGTLRPGLVLDRQPGTPDRHPIAMVGKVYCRVTAEEQAIEVGDLLTSSAVRGCAMKATDAERGFGTVIGKALQGLTTGRGLIPIVIALQ